MSVPSCSRRRLGWLSVAMAAIPAAASGSAPTVSTAPAAPCSTGQASALREIACELLLGLSPGKVPLAVASGPARGLRPGSPGEPLAARLTEVVTRALTGAGVPATAVPGAPGLAAARALSARGTPLLHLQPEIVGGELRVVATVHVPGRTIWDRIKDPSPEPRATASVGRTVDAEIQALVGQVPLTALAPAVKAPHGVPDVVAAACGPLLGPHLAGAFEIALVGRQRIVAGHLQGARFAARAEVPWSSLSPVAASPLREPIASAWLVSGGGLAVGTTDRARGVVLSPAAALLRSLDAQIPWRAVGCVGRSGLGLGDARACPPVDASLPRVDGPATAVDAIAGAHVVDVRGDTRAVAASREPSGLATLRDSAGRSARIPRVGAALAVADPDRDGQPELVASEPVRDAKDDAVVVRTWTAAGAIEERQRVTVPDGVRAIAACPPDGPGLSPLVVVTPRELWVLR